MSTEDEMASADLPAKLACVLVRHKELITLPAVALDVYQTATMRLGVDPFDSSEWTAGCQCGWIDIDETYLYSEARLAWAEHALTVVIEHHKSPSAPLVPVLGGDA